MALSYDFEFTKDRDKICIKEMLSDLIKIRDHSKSTIGQGKVMSIVVKDVVELFVKVSLGHVV